MRVKALETMLVLILALLIGWYVKESRYFLLAAGILAFIGAFLPALAEKIHLGWMKLGLGLGFVTSKIMLTTIFFVFLLPLSWLSRLFRKPVMKMKRQGNSYFKERNFTYTKESMENVW